ncbi:hypothetical protein QWY90_02925 [Flavobacterium paronense]|uniref:Uncharacterized protein n=1 Tax=Flavobacterium paronense TaxID=1392775 RepID=A0ABV5GCS5_9FLAO|nr:hypothetical protein [Flavobacterium paronense]MDN3676260.1 hypothetical protein [Flavobacterium paronense]
MKKQLFIVAAIALLSLNSCVQKTQWRTVVFTLNVSGIPNIKTVGVRGWDSPLSWDKDFPMKEVVKDSLYQVTISGRTGRLYTEMKFSINGQLEEKIANNRQVYFDTKSNVTKVNFVFDKE